MHAAEGYAPSYHLHADCNAAGVDTCVVLCVLPVLDCRMRGPCSGHARGLSVVGSQVQSGCGGVSAGPPAA
jgi:hypothetical protein